MLTAAMAAPACASGALITGSLPPHEDAGQSSPAPAEHLLVLGFAGDIGFTGHGDVPSTEGAVKHGAVIPWDRFTPVALRPFWMQMPISPISKR